MMFFLFLSKQYYIGQGPNHLGRCLSNNHSIKSRRRSLDPDLWKQRPFVIVDPSDPEEILYLREGEFHQYQRVSLSNGINLTIIARDTTPVSEIGPVQKQSSQEEQTAQTSTSSSHIKKSPPILGLIGSLFNVRDDLLVELSNENIVRSLYFKYIVKLYFWTFGKHSVSRHRVALDFVKSIQKILKHQGPMGVILRLKVSLIALNAFVGDCPLKSTHDLGTFVALSHGIPKWIPRPVRTLIRKKDLNIIRIWASVLNTYKGLKGSWDIPSLASVCASPVPEENFCDLGSFSAHFWEFQKWVPKKLCMEIQEYTEPLCAEGYPYLVSPKAGPNAAPAYSGFSVLLDSIAWMGHPKGPFYHILKLDELFYERYSPIGDIEAVKEYILTTLPIPLDHFESDLKLLYTDPSTPGNKHILGIFRKKGIPIKDTSDFLMKKSPYLRMKDQYKLYKALQDCRAFKKFASQDRQNDLRLALVPFDRDALCLGRLHNIQEAAGKNRIIAINDFWTQQLLRPLHLWLFEICKKFPQDSTFDQEGSLARFVAREGIKEYFSYDLSAATDMIPVGVYKAVLTPLIGTERAQVWIDLLTDKDFVVPFRALDGQGKKASKVRYTRGQPMGALSSWGLLNLSHHVIVQYARLYAVVLDLLRNKSKSKYWSLIPEDAVMIRSILREGKLSKGETWSFLWSDFISLCSRKSFYEGLLPFDKYVVLGDDVVIGDREVAEAYYEIMTQHYFVKIKLAKSYVSSSLVNFANQTFWEGKNISPIPFKELLRSDSLAARFEFASRVVRRWFSATSAVQYLKLVLNNNWYQRLKISLGSGKVLRPLLPVLFALTLVRAPIIGMNTFTDDAQGVEDRFSAWGALAGNPEALYRTVLNSFDLSKVWRGMFGEEYKESKRFRSYILFLIKDLCQPYLGNLDTLEPNPHQATYTKASVRNWDGLDEAPVIDRLAGNPHDQIWIQRAFARYEHQVQKIDVVVRDMLQHKDLSTDKLCAILALLLDEPDLAKTVHTAYGGWCYTEDQYEHEQTYHRLIRSCDESERQDKKARQRKADQTIGRLMKTTATYLELGGYLLEDDPVAELNVNQNAQPAPRGVGEVQTIPNVILNECSSEISVLDGLEDRTEDPAR